MIAFSKQLASDPRCARVISITSIAGGDRSYLSDLSRETRRTFLSSDGRAALIEVLPVTSMSLRDQVGWVREIRKTRCAAALTGAPGATLKIGGIPALNADYQSIVSQIRIVPVTAMVVVGTLLALLGGFRSLFAAVKAISTEPAICGGLPSELLVLSLCVCVPGWTRKRLCWGVPGGTGQRVPPWSPIVAFAIVFGLSMDYEVFLVARVLGRRGGAELSEVDAIPEGMARTAEPDYQRCRDHDRLTLRGIHIRKLSGGQDDRVHTGGSRADRRDTGSNCDWPGAASYRRRLELVAWRALRGKGVACNCEPRMMFALHGIQ